VQARRAADAAYEAELILRMSELSPDAADPQPDHPGAGKRGWAPDAAFPGVSEFFPTELAVVLNCGRGTAAHRLRRAWTWRESLPGTWAALAAGVLDERRGHVLADTLAHTDPAIARVIEARLLPEAGGLSLNGLRERAVALLLELDADAVDRHRDQARRAADVRVYPSHLDGMAALTADLPAEEAAACYALVDQLARMLKADGDQRPIGQLRATVLSMLIRRPADHGLGSTRITLTVTAALDALSGDTTEPGAVGGLPITAGHLRELLRRAGALGLTAPDHGSLSFALTDDDGELLAPLTLTQLQQLARRGCPTHPDEMNCECPVTGRPPATDAYEPTDPQRRFVNTRDRRCRFPNCGQRVGWAARPSCRVPPRACEWWGAGRSFISLGRGTSSVVRPGDRWHIPLDSLWTRMRRIRRVGLLRKDVQWTRCWPDPGSSRGSRRKRSTPSPAVWRSSTSPAAGSSSTRARPATASTS